MARRQVPAFFSGRDLETTARQPAGAGVRPTPPGAQPAVRGDATGGVIPYKNPKALIAYYCGIFSILPFLGLFLGIAGFTLGILGLKDRKRNPQIRGAAHAAIGISCGGLMTLLWGGLLVLAVVTPFLRGRF